MYSNPYIQNVYNPQAAVDRINNQIAELEKMKQQIPQSPISQPTNLTQNFQLAPSNNLIKYANSIEEVQKDMVISDTPYFSKDFSVVWVKSTNGNIKTYELNEIIPKDEKDFQIEYLQAQIEELKKGMKANEQYATNDDAEYDETSTTEDDRATGATIKENKSTSISRVSTSKKK